MPAVSVVLPFFNAEQSVEVAVRSILAQTFRDLEVIAVDDGSTDDSRGIIESISDPRIRLICTDHSGVAKAANIGLDHASDNIEAQEHSGRLRHHPCPPSRPHGRRRPFHGEAPFEGGATLA